MITINVQNKDIALMQVGDEVYVSLTDLTKGEDGSDHIRNWMRNRNTIEFLGLWETLNNPNFKGVEFDTFRREAGLNSFNMTPKKWSEATGAIGIISKAGNNGGTFAHKDLALEFCTWLSPMFKLLVLKEFQRLKELEQSASKWDLRRYLSKVNYRLQTDAVKEVLIPFRNVSKGKEGWIYAEEADLIYIAMFGYTSKKWRDDNPELAKKGYNLRDVANTHQLIILSNLENLNSAMINGGQTDRYERLKILRKESINQIKALRSSNELEHELIDSPHLAKQKSLTETEKPQIQTPDLSSFNMTVKSISSKKGTEPPTQEDLF
jgi:hypothetical protein